MIRGPVFRHVPDATEGRRGPTFVATHRALVVCTREFGQLTDGIARHTASLHDSGGVEEEPAVRRTPDRCIVQLGPVALTLAWLRSTLNTVAEGQLLVVVWRGAVAPGSPAHPQHAQRIREARNAAVLWEDVFSVSAESEETWRWRSESGGGDFSSATLAESCAGRLRDAYAESGQGA